MKGAQAKQSSQGGFVLILTLWVLVIVAFAAGYFAERVARSVELARQSLQNTRAMIEMADTRAEILYRLSTISITEYGLGRGNTTIRLDNRPYHGEGDTLIRLQDTRGLFNLNLADDDTLYRFLGMLGIPGERRGHMIATLRDFTDADKLQRLNGAEDQEYRQLNLPPPKNGPLVTPWETRRIIGWRDMPQLWGNNRFIALATTGIPQGINPNTAPAEVLATLPGGTEEIARFIIARRQLSPILNSGQFSAITLVPELYYDLQLNFLPGSTMRITQQATGLSWGLQYNITLTPLADDAPWQTDYYTRIGIGAQADTAGDLTVLPPRSTAPPAAPPDFFN
jgi:type II secretory pathway component PulK